MLDQSTIIDYLKKYDGDDIKLMEVCGTHTNSIFRHGIHSLLPKGIKLVSGPGCPVCVTSAMYIDKAAQICAMDNTVLYTFGDMIKVPGLNTSLSLCPTGSVEIMYSPMQVYEEAVKNSDVNFVVAAVGFETTIPTYALLIDKIVKNNIKNIKFLTSLKTIIPALSWICDNNPQIDGFIAPGHVSVILGSDAYIPFCEKYGIPLSIAGFEAAHILAAIYDLVIMHQKGISAVHNLYKSAVSPLGNTLAQEKTYKYFTTDNTYWRGLGSIEGTGLFLRSEYSYLDAGSYDIAEDEPCGSLCMCGNIIMGKASPPDCPMFGTGCNPSSPMGPCMVSTEGTCGIWYRNGVRG